MYTRWALLCLCLVAAAGCGQSGSVSASSTDRSPRPPASSTPDTDPKSGTLSSKADPVGKREALSSTMYSADTDLHIPGSAAVGQPKTVASAAPIDADILGHWKGEMSVPKTKADDPAAAMAASMAKMMASNLKLEFKPGGKFALDMMIPFEGSYTRKGRNLTLKMERIAGMTPEEAQKASNSPNPAKNEPMKAVISEDGKTITVTDDKPTKASMIFHREAPRAPARPTVSGEESKLVGSYSAAAEVAKDAKLTDQDKKDLETIKRMKDTFGLELRADNTCSLRMVFELTGTWKLSDGKVVIDLKDAMGLSSLFGEGKESTKNKPVKLLLRPDGSLRWEEDGSGKKTLVFMRK